MSDRETRQTRKRGRACQTLTTIRVGQQELDPPYGSTVSKRSLRFARRSRKAKVTFDSWTLVAFTAVSSFDFSALCSNMTDSFSADTTDDSKN